MSAGSSVYTSPDFLQRIFRMHDTHLAVEFDFTKGEYVYRAKFKRSGHLIEASSLEDLHQQVSSYYKAFVKLTGEKP